MRPPSRSSLTTVSRIFTHLLQPVVLLAVVTYLSIFTALLITDRLPTVPDDKKTTELGVSVKEAWEDLKAITAHPHPYNSHVNDDVRAYLLSRVLQIQAEFPNARMEVADDMASNGSWAGRGYGTYFEGTNILVKIEGNGHGVNDRHTHSNASNEFGERKSNNGILFSAHYDSVSTAPGATDDGMGVVTVLQLIKYFARESDRLRRIHSAHAHRAEAREGGLKRTVVFNLNNGEEDWLNGAHAFLEHPWSQLVGTFMNLEGAAAGGRPILLRASSSSTVRRAFTNHALVPHPHANVLSSDAFARGLIRSGTDYSVYTGVDARPTRTGMQGLDLAFYKGRSRYHTRFDGVQYTLGGEKSLWSMLEVARGAGEGLVQGADTDHGDVDVVGGKPEGAVYFDLFKSLIVVCTLDTLLVINIVLLVVGPVLLLLSFLGKRVLRSRSRLNGEIEVVGGGGVVREDISGKRQTGSRENGPHTRDLSTSAAASGSSSGPGKSDYERKHSQWIQTLWRHLQFWICLLIVGATCAGLVWLYVAVNPFAIYSSPYIIFFSFASLAYLTSVFVINLPSSLPFYSPSPSPSAYNSIRLHMHLYIFTWLLLLLATLGLTLLRPGVGGGYVFSVWNGAAFGGAVLGALRGEKGNQYNRNEMGRKGKGRKLGGGGNGELEEPDLEIDPTERTPLMRRSSSSSQDRQVSHSATGLLNTSQWTWMGTWICQMLQFLVSVPIQVILVGEIAMLLLDGMTQGIADGASVAGVYVMTALPAILLVVPLVPFSYDLGTSRLFTCFIALVFLGTSGYGVLTFPFGVGGGEGIAGGMSELKVFFGQRVVFEKGDFTSGIGGRDISNVSGGEGGGVTMITSLTGPERYIRSLVDRLPSASEGKGKEVVCTLDKVKPGLTRCEWASGGGMVPVPAVPDHETPIGVWGPQSEGRNEDAMKMQNSHVHTDPSIKDYFRTLNATRTGTTTARITVRGVNTRNCRVYFDSAPIYSYKVNGNAGGDYTLGTMMMMEKGTQMQDGYGISEQGINEVRLWSRTWEREFVVDVDWGRQGGDGDNKEEAEKGRLNLHVGMKRMEGRIACEWVEYESGMIDVGSGLRPKAKIPAFEEVLAFLPPWATVSKVGDGLVEVEVGFEV